MIKPYSVEGQIKIDIVCEIDAESQEDAIKQVFEMFKEKYLPCFWGSQEVNENHSLEAFMFDDVDYTCENED